VCSACFSLGQKRATSPGACASNQGSRARRPCAVATAGTRVCAGDRAPMQGAGQLTSHAPIGAQPPSSVLSTGLCTGTRLFSDSEPLRPGGRGTILAVVKFSAALAGRAPSAGRARAPGKPRTMAQSVDPLTPGGCIGQRFDTWPSRHRLGRARRDTGTAAKAAECRRNGRRHRAARACCPRCRFHDERRSRAARAELVSHASHAAPASGAHARHARGRTCERREATFAWRACVKRPTPSATRFGGTHLERTVPRDSRGLRAAARSLRSTHACRPFSASIRSSVLARSRADP